MMQVGIMNFAHCVSDFSKFRSPIPKNLSKNCFSFLITFCFFLALVPPPPKEETRRHQLVNICSSCFNLSIVEGILQ